MSSSLLHVVGLKGVGGVEWLFNDYMGSPARGAFDESVLVLKTIHPFFAEAVVSGATHVFRQKYVGPLKIPRQLTAVRRSNVRRMYGHASPELVVAWGAVPNEIWSGVARERATPIVYYDHGMSWHVNSPADLQALRVSDGLIAVSRAAQRMMELRIGYDGPVRVVPNGLRDSALFAAARAAPVRNPCEVMRVGYAGRLLPMKGVALAMHAVAELVSAGRPVELHVAGRGPEEQVLRSLAAKLGVDRSTHFHGLVRNMADFYAGVDVLVCPSLREPFGLVSVEAAASGCPVIASRVDGLPETFVEGTTGFGLAPELSLSDYVNLGGTTDDMPEVVYDPDSDALREPMAVDPAAIAERLMSLQDDPERYRRMSSAAREHAFASFGFSDYVKRLQDAFGYYLESARAT